MRRRQQSLLGLLHRIGILSVLSILGHLVHAEPGPGDVFREYTWTNHDGDAGGSLRVGGRAGYDGGPIEWAHEVDLEHATKAEIVIEKLLCHEGTRGLQIQVNGQDWISVPEASTIPAPQWDYQHFCFPVVPCPLSWLQQGGGNTFAFRVSDEHPWDWPQNLIYGVHLRVYYDPQLKPHPEGAIVTPRSGATVQAPVEIEAQANSATGSLRQVDFLGLYEDVNWQGDGQYRQWQYHFLKGQLMHHLGSVTEEPYRIPWDTTWVPDQSEPMQFAARIVDSSGLVYFTPAVEGINLRRPGVSVELCKPYDVPPKWVTRAGEKSEKFQVAGDLRKAVAAQLVWSSWSPGYMNGILINGQKVFDVEGPRYACYYHRVTLSDLDPLQFGENALTTGMTPRYDGQMVHGMEVNWPGIMVLIRYEDR